MSGFVSGLWTSYCADGSSSMNELGCQSFLLDPVGKYRPHSSEKVVLHCF